MAQGIDLSKLTDEQLGVYRDLLAKKQAPPPEKPLTTEAQPQTFGHGLTEFAKQLNPLPMITGAASTIAHPLDTARSIYNAQAGELSQVPKLVRNGQYSEAIGHGTAGLIPLVGPAAAKIGETIGGTEPTFNKYGSVLKSGQAPDPAGGVGAGAGLISSIVAAPRVAEAAGRAVQGVARPLVKSALSLPGKAEAFGADPVGAVLQDTKGIRPATIARTGQEKMKQLVPERARLIRTAKTPVDLQPARDMVTDSWLGHASEGNVPLSAQVEEMGKALNKNRVTGATYPRLLSPAEALDLERGFGDEFATYNPAIHEKANALAKDVRGNLSSQIYAAAPEAAPIGKRIQGLIPATRRAADVSRNAGALQKVVDRFSRPTGALTPALIGERIGGLPGGLAGLGFAEAVSDPMTKMLAARTLYGTGKLLRAPVTQRTIQTLPLLRSNQ